MKQKIKLKIGIDFAMTILLLFLMTYQITGQKLHEWLGSGMLLLFLIHNILNFKWYRNLQKGKYKPLRILQTIINFSIRISMLCLGFSGIAMSHYTFGFIDFGSAALARKMHLSASYWGFVLMSIHLGLHWSMVLGIFRKSLKGKKASAVLIWSMRVIALIIAGYGANCFYKADILSYMLLKRQFVFFDFNQSALSVFLEYMAMMELWTFIVFYILKVISKLRILKMEECL